MSANVRKILQTRKKVGAQQMLRLIAFGTGLFLAVSSAIAQGVPPNVQSPWLPMGRVADITAAVTSAATSLFPAGVTGGNVAWLCNSGSVSAYVQFGGSSVVATVAGGSILKAASCNAYQLQSVGVPSTMNTYVATITGSSTAVISVEIGFGNPK